MRRLFKQMAQLSSDSGFLEFQNNLVAKLYDNLGQGFRANEGEVAIVKRLVQAADGHSYRGVRVCATMLHGSRSYVEFNYLDKPVTKELGDMAVISLVTHEKKRVLQRLCIIQNKKETNGKWGLDIEQLFLLKNFPPFAGNKGIFRGCHGVSFRNYCGCLGAFGLLTAPGDMLFAAAALVTDFRAGKKSIGVSDIRTAPSQPPVHGNVWHLMFSHPFLYLHPKEVLFLFEEVFDRYGYPFFFPSVAGQHPFLGNTCFAWDLYDFTRSWTQLSMGEVTCSMDTAVNPTVDAFANLLLRSAGFPHLSLPPTSDVFGDR